MIKFAIIIVLIPVLAVAGIAIAMMYLVKSSNKRRKVPKSIDKSVLVSKTGTCSRCGEVRVLVKQPDSLCAFCYSSLNTKKQD